VETAITNSIRSQRGLPVFRNISQVTFGTVSGEAVSGIQFIMAYYYAFMFQPIVQSTMSRFATEKSEKIKIGLLMMGASETAYTLSLLFSESVFGFLTMILVLVVTFVGRIVIHSSPIIFGILVIQIILCFIFSGGILSVIGSNPRQASGFSNMFIVANLVAFGLCQSFVWKLRNDVVNHLVMLIPTVAFCRAIDMIATLELNGKGAQFTDMDPSIAMALYMLTIDCVMLFVSLMYLNRVFPGKNGGTSLPFGFFLEPQFWFPSRAVLPNQNELGKDCVLSVQAISKEFKKSKKTFMAVDDFSLELEENQIFVLLG
jgi:hypothetical protein